MTQLITLYLLNHETFNYMSFRGWLRRNILKKLAARVASFT